jgi:hypothetical protein
VVHARGTAAHGAFRSFDLDQEVVLDVDGSRITSAVAQEHTRTRAGWSAVVDRAWSDL